MSGGYFDTIDIAILEDKLERYIVTMEAIGYPPSVIYRFNQALKTLTLARKMMRAIDYRVEDDTGDETFLADFKSILDSEKTD